MNFSEDIEEESPCFIVLDSQSEEGGTVQRCDPTPGCLLKQLALSRPNVLPVDESRSTAVVSKATSCSSSIDSVLPNSNPTSTSGTHSSSLSTSSSHEEFSEKRKPQNYKYGKIHPLRKLLITSSQEDLFHNSPQGEKFLTSTPLVNSCSVVSPYNLTNKGAANLTPFEETRPTEIFQCLQLSGDIKAKETSSSEEVVSPSSDNLKPSSPLIEGSLKVISKGESKKKQEGMVQSTVPEKPDGGISPERTVHEHQNETSLPKWQKDCIIEENEKTSVCNGGTLSRTTSETSTDNGKATSSVEVGSCLQQWQSQNCSDELFENGSPLTNCDSINLQVSKGSRLHCAKGPTLPELSEDIFHPRGKGSADEPVTEKEEPSPAENGIIPPSQEENVFSLYLTQSQSTNPPSQVPVLSTVECGKQSEAFVDVPRSESFARLPSSPSQSILPQTSSPNNPAENNQTAKPPHPENTTETVVGKEPELLKKNDNVELEVICSGIPTSNNSNTTKIVMVDPKEAPLTTEDTVESTESGNVAFHFSPPTVLLRPTLTNTPSPCFQSGTESPRETLKESSNRDVGTSEFETVLPEVSTKTLSLSAPVRCDESTDEDINSPDVEFNLKKVDFVSDPATVKVVSRPVRSLFTNVRERFKATRVNGRKDEQDPYGFTDEVSSSPLRKRIAKRMDEKRDYLKKREINQKGLDKNVSNRKRKDVDNLEEKDGKRKKINEISENIEFDDPELSEETDHSKQTFWKVVKTRTITTTTTVVEREIVISYTDLDGKVLSSETKHEFDEPTYTTRAADSVESREAVDEIPVQKSSTNDKKDEDIRSEIHQNSNTDLNQPSSDMSKSELEDIKRKRSSSSEKQRSLRKKPAVQMGDVEDLHEGSRVLAQWFDKHYYPGVLVSKNDADSKYRVTFDDGDSSYIREEDILAVEYLSEGQPVMVREEHGDCYDNGVIRGFYQTRQERGYKMTGEDGRVQNCPRSRVILNAEQAAIFLSLQSYRSESNSHTMNERSAVYPSNSSGSITRPNRSSDASCSPRMRSAERANVSKLSREKPSIKPQTSCDKGAKRSRTSCEKDTNDKATKRNDDVEDWVRTLHQIAKQGSDISRSTRKQSTRKSETKQKRLSTSETPKSSHKSAMKTSTENNMGNNCDISGEQEVETRVGKVRRRLSSAMKVVIDKTRAIPTRKSPRKVAIRGNIQVNDENLVLPTNQDLFRGYGFIITGSDVNSVSNGDENSPGENEHPFNRAHVRRQVEVGGGVVLPTFHDDFSTDDCYLLLSNSCQTTAKYFYALVVGVPCLSHVWVQDCCSENKLISYKNYLLPAGRDLVTERLVEEQKCSHALTNMKVYLVGDEEFKVQWNKVLRAAGCEIVNKLPPNVLKDLQYGNQDFNCDVIVVGSDNVSHSTIRKARLYGIPTVTIHWVKQCILTGKRVPFNAHSSFSYKVKEGKW